MQIAGSSFDVHRVRKDFPMLQHTMHGKPLIYLDSAATTQKPLVVIEAISSFYREHYGTVHRAVYELAAQATEQYQGVRKSVARFLHARLEDEIIFTRGTTDSINLVASSFGAAFVKKGDEILISAMEHHANIVPWQMLCERKGALLKVIPMNEKGELELDIYRSLLSEKTKLVAVTHLANSIGTLNPIKQMAAWAHEAGACFLADGAQSAAHLPIDVQELDVDFFVFSGHKIVGPTGIGILYGKEALLKEMPPYQGGGDMIESVSFAKTTYREPPMKFEAGTPMIAEVIGLGAAIDYLTSLGMPSIQSWESQLLAYATEKMQAIPSLRLIGEASAKGAILSFSLKGIHPLDLGVFLDLKGIAMRTGHHCAQPVMQFFGVPATARVSFGCYNTLEEIDHLVSALEMATKRLG